MARVQNLTQADTGKDISKVAIGTLFTLIIQIVYLIAFLAMYLALIIRVAALWIMMAFSPFLVLMYYLTKDLNIQAGGVETNFSIAAFTKWAFVPAAVGAVWSVGFIMITTGQTMSGDIFTTLNDTGAITGKVFSASSLFLGMESLQQFIWLIMTIGIIWVGTFAALSKLPVVGAVTGAIKGYGDRIGKVVGSVPKWAPIIPLYDYKTGKLDWSKRVGLGALSPAAGLESLQARQLSKQRKGLGGTMKFEDARQELDKSGRRLVNETAGLEGERLFNKVKELSGNKFDKNSVKNDLTGFNNMIDSLKHLDPKEKTYIKEGIAAHVGGLPATVPAPTVDGDDVARGAEKGVRDGLMATYGQNEKAKVDKIMARTREIMETDEGKKQGWKKAGEKATIDVEKGMEDLTRAQKRGDAEALDVNVVNPDK